MMARKKATIAVDENVTLLAELDLPGAGDVGGTPPPAAAPDEGPEPHDGDWQDYVLGKLWVSERVVDQEGNVKPRADGLARIFPSLMGVVLESFDDVMESGPGRAVVVHRLKFECKRTGREKHWSGTAEVNRENTKPPYVHYAANTAATVAKGRCYKSALYLQCLTAEEKPPEGAAQPAADRATEADMSVMRLIFTRTGIDEEKFFRYWKLKAAENRVAVRWERPEDMPADTASRLLERLNQYQQKAKPIPEEVLK
jgi:hypothetical protein